MEDDMSFGKYLLDELAKIIKATKKGNYTELKKDKKIVSAIEQCLRLGCSKEDIDKTIRDTYFDNWLS